MKKVEIFKGKFLGFDQARIRRLRSENKIFIKTLSKKLANDLADRARAATPKDTGKAAKSIRIVRGNKGFEIRPDVVYYPVIEEGHKALVARKGKRFVFNVGGRTVYATKIKARKGKFVFKNLNKLLKQGGLVRRAGDWAFRKSFD